MNHDLCAAVDELANIVVKNAQPCVHFVTIDQWPVAIGEIEFVVIVQVVWCADDRDDAAKIVFAEPDDLFLTANSTMVDAVATWAFTNGELVFNDPCEIARGDPERPLST